MIVSIEGESGETTGKLVRENEAFICFYMFKIRMKRTDVESKWLDSTTLLKY